jgi:hypothetical protein
MFDADSDDEGGAPPVNDDNTVESSAPIVPKRFAFTAEDEHAAKAALRERIGHSALSGGPTGCRTSTGHESRFVSTITAALKLRQQVYNAAAVAKRRNESSPTTGESQHHGGGSGLVFTTPQYAQHLVALGLPSQQQTPSTTDDMNDPFGILCSDSDEDCSTQQVLVDLPSGPLRPAGPPEVSRCEQATPLADGSPVHTDPPPHDVSVVAPKRSREADAVYMSAKWLILAADAARSRIASRWGIASS